MLEIYVRFITAMRDRQLQPERGASIVEYTLLLAFIVIVCLIAVQFLGHQTSSQFDNTGSSLFG